VHNGCDSSTHANNLIVHLLEVTVNFLSVDREIAERLGLVARLDNRSVGETFSLGDEVDLASQQWLGVCVRQ
jgi:hypothetical protein